jgi:hypothetical protein
MVGGEPWEVAPLDRKLKVLDALQARLPDFLRYLDEITRLSRIFGPTQNLPFEQYVEGLYWIAKYASFSQADSAVMSQGRPVW